jgi:hypothetical protein
MESLESKLDRLSPEQRREIEDFVDFLLQRAVTSAPAPLTLPGALSPQVVVATPPPPIQDPDAAPESVKLHDLIRHQEPQDALPHEDPVTLLMQEIAVDDSLTGDYMDYGIYEQPPSSPATEAVKRVKEKMSHKKVHDPAKQLLEWID